MVCFPVRMLLFLAMLTAAGGGAAAQGDWPNFRGPNHDGISAETGLQTTWTKAIPLVWEKEIGSGFSSFACVGNRVYTCGTLNKRQVIFCLHADTGDILWQKDIEEEYRESSGGDGPRSTPTVDDGKVYMLGGHGTLLCLNAEDGDEVWKTKLTDAPYWGYSGSVLVEGGRAIVASGRKTGSLIAFDKNTGKERWRCGEDSTGYATPYPFSFAGTRYVVGFTGKSALIAEMETGRIAWRMPWNTDWSVNAATPIFHDGHLFLSSGYQTGCGLFKLIKEGDGLRGEEVWKSRVLRNKFQTPILHEGKLYTSDQRALLCVDFMTGERLWHKVRVKHGTVVLADGHLFLLTEKGQLRIAPVSAEGFEPATTAGILSGRCWTVPVLHRGRLYARSLTRMVCFDLRSDK